MKFAVTTKAEPLSNKPLRAISLGVGFWTVGIAVAQMVSFEAFIEALRSYHVAGERGTLVLATTLLALEIYSVPFWFRLTLSPLGRAVSAVLALVAPFVWTLLLILGFVTSQNVQNAGYFGGFIKIPLGDGMALTLLLVWVTLVTIGFGSLGGWKALHAVRGRSKR